MNNLFENNNILELRKCVAELLSPMAMAKNGSHKLNSLFFSFHLNTNPNCQWNECVKDETKYRLNLAKVHNRTTERSTTTHVYENTAVFQ